MATTAGLFHTIAHTVPLEPTIHNNYLVNFHDWSGVTGDTGNAQPWVNPYTRNMHAIQPFIPGNCTDLIDLFNASLNKECLENVFFLDPFIPTFAKMDLKDLMSFSQTSKCCYLATKSKLIWQAKIKLLLCNVTFLFPEKCTFTSEQQFQVAFKHLQIRQKPYHFQFSYNLEKYVHLIPQIQESPLPSNHIQWTSDHWTSDHWTLNNFVGINFNGTPESITPYSAQGRCLAALDLIREELNCPESFEHLIRAAEIAANTSSTQNSDQESCLAVLDCPRNFEHLIPACPTGTDIVRFLNDDILISEEFDAMGPDDDYNFELIETFSDLQNPTEVEINEALSAFKGILSVEIKRQAFTLITARALSGDVVAPFFEALPESLKNEFKG